MPNSPGEAVQPVSTPSPGPTTQSKLRVLIVDDDSSMARFLTSHLSRRGFEINIANNGEEAIRMFRVFDPNLVHAVFVAVKRQQAAIAAHSGGVERVQHHIGSQARIRMGVAHRG